MKPARLLIDPPLPGPDNMARDEALLQAAATPGAQPVLRFYAWSPPTISLGYFQNYTDFDRLPPPAGDLPVVRRTTGGGAILHDMEITYALVIPLAHPLGKGRPRRFYELAHQAIIDAIGHGTRLLGTDHAACDVSPHRGPFFCFDRRHCVDVVIDDPHAPDGLRKVSGSAQRRTADAVLQHGSVMLDSRYAQQTIATWSEIDAAITFDQAAERLAPAFSKSLDLEFTPDSWRDEDLQNATRLQPRYAGSPWTVHRQR